MDRLFVYGTLRRGAENEFAQLLEKSARFLSQACIRGRLFRVAYYPGLAAPEDRNDWVKGDVFDGVTAEMLQRLDDYEGPEYSRQLAEVTLEGGGSIRGVSLPLCAANRRTGTDSVGRLECLYCEVISA